MGVPLNISKEFGVKIHLMHCRKFNCTFDRVITSKHISGQLPTRTISHHAGTGPDEWFYWLVVVLVGSCPSGDSPRDHDPGGQYLGFIFIQWAIVPSGELS